MNLDTTQDLTGKRPNIVNQNTTTKNIHNPLSMKHLCFAWDVSKNRPRSAYLETVENDGKSAYVLQKELETGIIRPVGAKSMTSVIDCRATALKIFTPEKLFVIDRIKVYVAQNVCISRKERADKEAQLRDTFRKLGRDDRQLWESRARSHDERWPEIRDSIIVSLQNNGTKGFRQVEEDIRGWCSHATIAKWMKEHKTYSIYTERICHYSRKIKK